MMNNLTVAQLIQILQTMPQDAVVEISMNQEYQSRIERSNVVFYEADSADYKVPTVVIDDCE